MEILRDEYLDYMTFRAARRPLLVELFGPLVGLDAEWRAQGASEAEIALTAFGFDHVRRHGVAAHTGFLGGSAPVVLEETDEYTLSRDALGRTCKLYKKVASIALPLEYPVRDMDSWLRVKPHYEFSEERFGAGWAEAARAARDGGALIVAAIPGGFGEPRALMGEENLCLAYYEQPELIHDMLRTIGGTAEPLRRRRHNRAVAGLPRRRRALRYWMA